MSSCRDFARALIYFDQNILTLLVCEDFIVTKIIFVDQIFEQSKN